MQTISKTLLSVILNTEIEEILEDGKFGYGPNMVQWSYDNTTDMGDGIIAIKADGGRNGINIYELANLCKEWAKQESVEGIQCVLYSAPTEPKSFKKYVCHIGRPFEYDFSVRWVKTFTADSEPESIFRACEWILDNKDPK